MLLDTSTKNLAMLSGQVKPAALNSGKMNSTDVVVAKAELSWIENMWAMGDGRQAAIVDIRPDIPLIPAADLLQFSSRGLVPAIVRSQGATSYLMMGTDRWVALDAGAWVTVFEPSSATEVSIFILKDITYIFSNGNTMQEFDPNSATGNEFEDTVDVTLAGITQNNIVSACAALGYMVLVDTDTVYYSSPLNERYFTPGGTGINSGAGSAKVLGINSAIIFVAGAEDGFHIFTVNNIVKATYSNDPDNPWIFDIVNNSTGVFTNRHALIDSNLTSTFAWAASGLALLNQNEAKYIFPKVTELLAGDKVEDYNDATRRLELLATGITFDVQLFFIGNRQLCISYGPEGITKDFILMYDTVLGEWSRIRYPHLAILSFVSITSGGKIFDDWLEHFDDTVDTFEDMLGTDTNPQVNTVAIGVVALDGSIRRLTPIDISTLADTADFQVLKSRMIYPDLRLSRSAQSSLSKVTVVTDSNSFALNSARTNDDTAVYGYSDTDPAVRQFKELPALNEFDTTKIEYVEVIVGARNTIVLEGINSLKGLEINLDDIGETW